MVTLSSLTFASSLMSGLSSDTVDITFVSLTALSVYVCVCGGEGGGGRGGGGRGEGGGGEGGRGEGGRGRGEGGEGGTKLIHIGIMGTSSFARSATSYVST